MARVGVQNSIHASIELESLRLSYAGGDVLQGIVKRVQLTDAPQPITVTISLVGRIKTKVIKSKSGDESDDHYYAKSDFHYTRTCIFQGQTAQGINTWPFALTLPTTLDGKAQEQSGYEAAGIPPTYCSDMSEHIGLSLRRNYLYCEYVLEAEVASAADPRHPAAATFPLFVRPPTTETDHLEQRMVVTEQQEEVKTLHLDPKIGDQSLSVRQHLQSIFQRSTMPQYGYNIAVEHPAVLQIESTATIPFRISASPNLHATNRPYLVDKPPALAILDFDLRLQYATKVSHLDGRSRAANTENSWGDLSRLRWQEASGGAGQMVPYTTASHTEPLDVGQSFEMRVNWHGLVSSSQPRTTGKDRLTSTLSRQLWPSFKSYYLSSAHRLAWSLKIDCAVKTRTLRGESPVTVLGPSKAWEAQTLGRLGPGEITKAHSEWAEHTVKVPALASGVELTRYVGSEQEEDLPGYSPGGVGELAATTSQHVKKS